VSDNALYKLETIVVTIGVTDIDQAEVYYQKLGFTREWTWPDDNPTHASFSRDGVSFMVVLKSSMEDISSADLYFRIRGTRQLYKSLSSAQIIKSELIKSSYGMLDFSITDPWGHHLTFGEPDGVYSP